MALPPGPQSSNPPQEINLVEWAGMNQSASRGFIADQEVFWSENLWPLAPGHLRAGYGPSAPIYTAPSGTTVVRIFCTNIDGTDPLCFAALSDGTMDQVNLNSGAVTSLGQVWGPATEPYYCDVKLWAPNQFGNTAGEAGGVVIGSPQGLYAWDGSTLTSPGEAAPNWLTSDNATTMPSGLPGIYALEVYQQRLWVLGQTVISFSAPSNGANFSTAGGGGSFPYFGDQLTVSYTDLAANAGFLYVFGDSSTNNVSYVQVVGSGTVEAPLTTTFLYANMDPQVGQRFFRPVGTWSEAFTVFNGAGIYLLAGSTYTWISGKITNLFASIDPTPFQPTQCACHVFGQRWMLFNATLTDPWGVARSMILAWGGPQRNIWTVASQGYSLTNIASYEQNSCIQAYGTDGNVIVQLFAQPDPTLPKRLLSKAYKGPHLLTVKNWRRVYLELHDNMHGPEGVTVTGVLHTKGGGIPNGREPLGFELPPGDWNTLGYPTAGAGLAAALDLESLSPDFVIEQISLTYDNRVLFGA